MIGTLLATLGRLTLLAGIGFVLFRPRWMQDHLAGPTVTLLIRVFYPLYIVARIPTGWGAARDLGAPLLLGLFALALAMMAASGLLLAWVSRRRWARVSQPVSWLILGAMHNAGFVPLPILERIVDDSIIVAMFFYLLAFMLVFWGGVTSIIESGHLDVRWMRFRLSPQMGAIALGTLLAVTGVWELIPLEIRDAWGRVGVRALDGALVALGISLAGIRERITLRREHMVFVLVRMVAWPAAMLAVAALPWPFLPPVLRFGLRVVLVLEAATPPAAQTMVMTRALGTPAQVHYTGETILLAYVVSLITIPVFVAAVVAIG